MSVATLRVGFLLFAPTRPLSYRSVPPRFGPRRAGPPTPWAPQADAWLPPARRSLGFCSFHAFVVSSTFAPDLTGSANAHQPRGRDEYAAAYRHYQVLGSKWRLDFNTGGSVAMYVGWCIRRQATTTSINDYIEGGDVKYSILGDNDASTGYKSVYGSVNVANYMGLSPTNALLEADNAASPSEQLYLHVFAVALDASLDAQPVDIGVTFDMDVKWREKRLLTQSV